MRSLKLAGVVACGLALSVSTATAAPQVLDDAALDGVVAGVDSTFSGGLSQSLLGGERPTFESVFGVFGPAVVLEIIIPLEEASDSKSTTAGNALTSVSETTGGPAEDFVNNPLASPYGFFPRFAPFLTQ